MTQVRTLDELINREEPGIELVREWSAESERDVHSLPVDLAAGEATLLALQVTTRSTLGALAYETGGVLIDRGWLRLLGGGSPRLPRSLSNWNQIERPLNEHRLPGALLVADDAMGGFFAINGGVFVGEPGSVFYLAPDTCDWEDLEMGHTDWVHWLLTGDLPGFYESMRWPGWETEVAELDGDRTISVYPPLWAKGQPVGQRSRRPVPIEETWDLHAIEYPRQLGPVPKS